MSSKQTGRVNDERKIPFTQIDNDIIDSMSFEKATDKLLYFCLCRFSFNGKKVFPSYGTLCKMAGIGSVNTLKAALQRLERMKLIRVKWGRKKPNGEYYPNLYTLLEPPAEIRENSVLDGEKLEEKTAEIKNKRAEKAKKKKAKAELKDIKIGVSNFDGGLSNFDGGLSKNDTEEYLSKNIDLRILKDNINQSIEKMDISERVKMLLIKNPDRLTDSILKVIENQFLTNKLDEQIFCMKLLTSLEQYKTSFKNHFRKSLANAINEQPAGDQQERQPVRSEIVPEWMNEKEQQQQEQDEPQETESVPPWEEFKAKFEKQLKIRP